MTSKETLYSETMGLLSEVRMTERKLRKEQNKDTAQLEHRINELESRINDFIKKDFSTWEEETFQTAIEKLQEGTEKAKRINSQLSEDKSNLNKTQDILLSIDGIVSQVMSFV